MVGGGSRRARLLALVALVAGVIAGVLPVATVRAATYTVTNTNDSGAGSLRAAIQAANNGSGDTITFNIGGGGLQTIQPTPMDFVRKPMTIDATTQPGYAGVPLIQLNGANAPGDSALTLVGGGATIRGFVINGYQGAGLNVASDGNRIEGNYICTDSSGTVSSANGTGIRIAAAPPLGPANANNNIIGGSTAAARNIVSGCNANGIELDGSNGLPVTGNTVSGNYVGLNPAGTALVKNPNLVGSNTFGLFILNASNNTIGGTVPGARNVLSGNAIDNLDKGAGIAISGRSGQAASGNIVVGNYIGTDATGSYAVLNNAGIYMDTAINNRVGGVTAAERNVVSGNRIGGVTVDGSFADATGNSATGNLIQGNYIGTNSSGTAAIPNGTGVEIEAANRNTVGGTAPGAGNLISGNTDKGIVLDSRRDVPPFDNGTAANNTIQGNIIGANVNGTAALGNAIGITISGGTNTTIGGTTAAARNLITGFTQVGVQIANVTAIGSVASGNVIQGNYIGTDIGGNTSLLAGGNVAIGVQLELSSNNTVGGGAPGAGNVIAYAQRGVLVNGGQSDGIFQNAIFANSSASIVLANNGNNAQAVPVLTGATVSGANQITVTGSLTSGALAPFRIEFFATPSATAQGRTFLDARQINAAGPFSFAIPAAPAGQYVTATASDAGSNTSPFSAARVVVAGPVASITPNAGTTPQTAQVNALYAPLAVTVRDAAGNPLSGKTVTFTAPTVGASGYFAGAVTTKQAVTDADGVASVAFQANDVPGVFRVTASVAGGAGPITTAFDLTNTVPPLPGSKPGGGAPGNPAPQPNTRPSGGAPGNPNPLPRPR